MRMRYLVLLYIIFTVTAGFSEDSSTSRAYLNMESRIVSGEMFQMNKLFPMQDANELLSVDERGDLYNKYSKTSGTKAVGFLLNIFLCPGLGNLVIGDYGGAAMSFFGTFGCGAIFTVVSVTARPNAASYLLFTGSAVGFAFFFLYDLISPFTYCDHYNYDLAVALKMNKGLRDQYSPKMDAILPAVMNVIPGFGAGSFCQGDTLGGLIGLGADISAGFCLAVGLINYLNNIYVIQYYEANDPEWAYFQEYQNKIQEYLTMMIVGGVIAGAGRLFGIIRPIWYAADYNKSLAYGSAVENTFALRPYIVPGLVKNKLDMQFGLNLEMGI